MCIRDRAIEAIDRRLAKEMEKEEQKKVVQDDGLERQELQARLRARQREIRKEQSDKG